ncbi:hydroxylamine reductase [Candidatus Omnitrophota bacterium]
MDMFCRQCEQTAGGKGCTVAGVCGKDKQTSGLQDLLIYSLEGISVYGKKLTEYGVRDKDSERFVIEALFSTVTNVNFDPKKLQKLILKSYDIKEKLKNLFLDTYKKKESKSFDDKLPIVAGWVPAEDLEALEVQTKDAGVCGGPDTNEDIKSLREILLYGLKGMAAYADHALVLGKEDDTVNTFFYKGLEAITDDSLSADDLVALNMEFGQVNLKCLELLDKAHTDHLGVPSPTKVSLGIKKGPAIIVSGHDLFDLEQLLEQTQDKGINIYTHNEMLPAHGYPGLNKYPHLAGNFGGAWQEQQKEFDNIPAAILMTTNCIQKPRHSYIDRIFTTGLVAWPEVTHIEAGSGGKKDFTKVIEKAIKLGGFAEAKEDKDILVGFGHNAVLSVADKIIGAVKSGDIKHFFLVGGCDGAKPGRNYYTDFAQKAPKDTAILTLACGKFRFNKLEFGDIQGIPRLIDCGQCNDSYSAIKIAVALAEAFKCGVNDLPLSLILSWYEQKAVCILLFLYAIEGDKDLIITLLNSITACSFMFILCP